MADVRVEINEAAPVVSRAEGGVLAPADKVWDLLVEVAAWPSWHPGISGVQYPGRLAPGATFRWKAGSRHLESKILAVQRPQLVAWEGSGRGARSRQVFRITPRETDCHVVTEASLEGLGARLFRRRRQRALDDALRAWIEALRDRAERS